ncbi:hypothetical protein [Hymenobacter metallilatus]|uniref:Uncharacterized protein n=1 Tax=Hymenobacter metallilatus TaxID=2493666 RepID=A0A3R9LV15_9BACT|nr:hypothetical protein [Hymenobacter metallilatus]RSK24159.1 hypothetical protein EI290_20470 [Hymenobacter metallilatus]
MTRASLLHILDHVDGISDAEIRELEQLAAAFPYCQSAHVLLAKAAHDRGSMLAGQRLRRAATYAANRELLRQLLEQPAAAPVAASAPVTVPEPLPSVPEHTEPLPFLSETATTPLPASSLASGISPDQAAEDALPAPVHPETPDTSLATEADALPQPVATSSEEPVGEETSGAFPSPEVAAVAPEPTAGETLTPLDPEQPALSSEAPATEEVALEETTGSTSAAVSSEEEVLPAVAPPIRPPADGGISRFEFGLAQPALAPPSGYQLPGLEEEEEAQPDAELPALGSLGVTPPPVVTAPFRADPDLGYALGAGSRLGYDLQAHDGYTLDLPLEAFFEPDALLLAHLRAHKPKPAASSLDLINRFLKAQPRIKTPGGISLPAAEQPDLSVRSTSVAPSLASESLANIMVRQGKKDKAIEIYERLMERQPEKKAYFAEQIQQLQQPSE